MRLWFLSGGVALLALLAWACGQNPVGQTPADSGTPDAEDGNDGPESPPLLGKSSELPFGEIMDFEQDENILYVVNYYGLMIYDVSSPETPILLSHLATRGEARRLAVRDGYAYIADGRSGLKIVEVSRPFSPALVHTVSIPDEVLSVAVQGATAVIACSRTEPRVYDIRNPISPVLRGTLPDRASDLAFAQNRLLVAETSTDVHEYTSVLQVLNLQDPENPVLLGSLGLDRPPPDVHHGANPQLGWGLAADNRYVYLADLYYGYVQMVDIQDPAFPTHLAQFSAQGEKVHGLWIHEGQLFAAVDDDILALEVVYHSALNVDVTVLDRIGSFSSTIIRLLACSETYALFLDVDGKILWFNITKIRHPVFSGSTPFSTGWAEEMALRGDVAVMAYTLPCGDECTPEFGGLTAILLSDSGAAQPLDDVRFASSYVRDLSVVDDMAYVVGNNGLYVLDISDPGRIGLLGAVQEEGFMGTAVAVSPPWVYVITAGQPADRLVVFDASDLQNIKELDSTALSIQFQLRRPRMVSHGYLLFVADTLEGLLVLDVADPHSPVEMGCYEIPTGDLLWDIAIDFPFVFAAAGMGMHVVDFGDPAHPEEVFFEDTPGYAQSVGHANNVLCVSDTHDAILYQPTYVSR